MTYSRVNNLEQAKAKCGQMYQPLFVCIVLPMHHAFLWPTPLMHCNSGCCSLPWLASADMLPDGMHALYSTLCVTDFALDQC
jgi:hypothetical protein